MISGIVVWTGNGKALVISHIVLGSILTLALFALAYQAYRAKVSLKLVLVAAVWGFQSGVWRRRRFSLEPETGLRRFCTCCAALERLGWQKCWPPKFARRAVDFLFTEMTGVGLGVALFSFVIGFIIRHWLGVDI